MKSLRISKNLFLFGDRAATWNRFSSPFSTTWGGIWSIHLFDNPLFWVYLHVGQSPISSITLSPKSPRPDWLKSAYNVGKFGRFHLRVMAEGWLQIAVSEEDRLELWAEVIQRRDAGYTERRIERWILDQITNWSMLQRNGNFIAQLTRPEHGMLTDGLVIARNPGFDSDENEYEYRTLTDHDGLWWYPESKEDTFLGHLCKDGEVLLDVAPY